MKLALASMVFASAAMGQQTCALAGRVVDQSDRPIGGVRVFASRWGMPGIRTISTNQGAFCFATLESGSYQIAAQRSGYVDAVYNGDRYVGARQDLKIEAGVAAAPVVIKLVAEAVVAGRVIDTAGNPVAGCDVRTYQQVPPSAARRIGDSFSTKTNIRGEFRFFELEPGDVYLLATPTRDFSPDRGRQESQVETYYPNSTGANDAVPIHVEAGKEVTGITIPMQTVALRRLSGRIVGLPGAKYLMAEIGSASGATQGFNIEIKADGTFYKDALPAGKYTLRVTNPSSPPPPKTVDLTLGDAEGVVVDFGKLDK